MRDEEPDWPCYSCGRLEMEVLARLACEIILDRDELRFRRKCGLHLGDQIQLAFSMDQTVEEAAAGVRSNWKATGEYLASKLGQLVNVAPKRADFLLAELPKTKNIDQDDIDCIVKILANALEKGEIVTVEDLTVAGMQYDYHEKRGRDPTALVSLTIDWRGGYKGE